MKNVLDVRKDNNLNFFLSTEQLNSSLRKDSFITDAAVFICLYYPDTVNDYFEYILSAVKCVDVYISSSNKDTEKAILDFIEQNEIANHCIFIPKDNRGRDISALLVSFRKIIKKYDYFCFVHDKKEKSVFAKEATADWIRNMWENTVFNDVYIRNIISTFDFNKSLGVLCPPEPFNDVFDYYYRNQWGENCNVTLELAKTLGISTDIDFSRSPVTIGTAFWAKTEALNKLLQYDWKYEDFLEEPLPDDGTISHAIERIIGFVAQDAGYETGNVLTMNNAGLLKEKTQDTLCMVFSLLEETKGIRSVKYLKKYFVACEVLPDFVRTHKEIYLYGAGTVGHIYYRWMKDMGIEPSGFVVSQLKESEKGSNIFEINQVENKKDIGIIIAVSDRYVNEVLTQIGDRDYLIL